MSPENMQQNFKLKDILLAKGGQIVYDDLTHLDISKNMESQIMNLKEDLLQVAFSNNIILDIGWYPSFDIRGSFHINLIKNSNWDKPIGSIKCKKITDLTDSVIKIISLINIK
jgi:hypothetical protein